MSALPTLYIEGLEGIDALELEEELGSDVVSVQRAGKPIDRSFGVLGIDDVVVIVLTTAAINALTVWMVKRRVTDKELEELDLKAEPGGKVSIKWRRESSHRDSAPPDPATAAAVQQRLEQVVKQAANLGRG